MPCALENWDVDHDVALQHNVAELEGGAHQFPACCVVTIGPVTPHAETVVFGWAARLVPFVGVQSFSHPPARFELVADGVNRGSDDLNLLQAIGPQP